MIYKKYKSILFALEIKLNKKTTKIIPNPGAFIIPEGLPRSWIKGYIICEDKSIADNISSYKQEKPSLKIFSQ